MEPDPFSTTMSKPKEQAAESRTGNSQTAQSIELQDGRTLTYAEHGTEGGSPLLFFHGTPGARTCVPNPAAVSNSGIHLVTVDRPGYGGSTPNPGRAVVDWAGAIAQLADALGIDRFAVAGLSGGGPHALACGALLPDRVTVVGVLSGMAPINLSGATAGMSLSNRMGFLVAKYVPSLLPVALRSMARQARNSPEGLIEEVRSNYSTSDQRVLDDPEIRRRMAREVATAYEQGTAGHVSDFRSLAQDWGFDPSDLSVPVRLWHGGEDRNAPLSMAESLAEVIPNSHLTIYPEEGHLMAYDHFSEIVSELIEPRYQARIRQTGRPLR